MSWFPGGKPCQSQTKTSTFIYIILEKNDSVANRRKCEMFSLCWCFSVNPAGSATSTSWLTSGCTRRLRSRRQLSFGASAASSTQSGCTCFPRPRCSVSSRETTPRLIWMTSSTRLKAVTMSDIYVFFEMLILVVLLCLYSGNTPSTMEAFTAAIVSSSGCGTSCQVTSPPTRGLCSLK